MESEDIYNLLLRKEDKKLQEKNKNSKEHKVFNIESLKMILGFLKEELRN